MKYKFLMFLWGSATGAIAALAIGTNALKNPVVANATIAASAALPTVGIVWQVCGYLSDRRIARLKALIESENKRNLSALEDKIKALTTDNTLKSDGFQSVYAELEESRKVNQTLRFNIDKLRSNVSEGAQEIEELRTEIQAWNNQFISRVEAEAIAKFDRARTTEIEKIFTESDAIAGEALAIVTQFQNWAEKIAQGHSSKKAIIRGLATSYNENLGEVQSAIDGERSAYVQQIELLNESVARLQQQNAGNLNEPIYGNFGFDRSGQIANELARILFSELGLPLRVEGFRVLPNGATEIGYSYSRNVPAEAIIEAIEKQKEALCRRLGIFRIVNIRKLEIAHAIAVSYRTEPAIKDSEIKLMLGSAEEFLAYVASRPIRYRIIADPGVGKTPTTAVMVSEILKTGTRRGNTSKGAKNPHTLVTVSYPGVTSSLKDTDYPLAPFLKYGDTTAANKSFGDAIADWDFRKKCPNYAAEFFHLWIWDELDNTLIEASDPQDSADNLKTILKQGGHSNIGWIVSGQSVMIKDLKGFTIDDRSLFTEMVIGIPKIRKYLQTYGKGRNSQENLAKLAKNLDEIEEWVDYQNERVTDDARLLRIALIADERSPKLYLLPNLDSAVFDWDAAEETRRLAESAKRSIAEGRGMPSLTKESQKPLPVSTDQMTASSSNPPMSDVGQFDQKPHCPHCGSGSLKLMSDKRYSCKDCKKRFVETKAVWK